MNRFGTLSDRTARRTFPRSKFGGLKCCQSPSQRETQICTQQQYININVAILTQNYTISL